MLGPLRISRFEKYCWHAIISHTKTAELLTTKGGERWRDTCRIVGNIPTLEAVIIKKDRKVSLSRALKTRKPPFMDGSTKLLL